MRRLRRAADSVNLASFLSPKEIRFQCIKWEVESRPKILIVGVLEKRGLLGIRNLDLKMNVFFLHSEWPWLVLAEFHEWTNWLRVFLNVTFFWWVPLTTNDRLQTSHAAVSRDPSLQEHICSCAHARTHAHACGLGCDTLVAPTVHTDPFERFVLLIIHRVSYLCAAVTQRVTPLTMCTTARVKVNTTLNKSLDFIRGNTPFSPPRPPLQPPAPLHSLPVRRINGFPQSVLSSSYNGFLEGDNNKHHPLLFTGV